MRKSDNKKKKVELLSAIIVFAVIVFWNSQAFSLDIMGPPAAGLQYGMFKAGVEYTNSKMDLELYDGTYTDYLDGELYDWGEALDVTLKDLKINRSYATFGYGIYDNVEVFVRLGGLNARFGDSIWEDSEKFDSGPELAGGAGVKLTFYQEGNIKLGGLFQFNTTEFDGQLKASHWAAADFVKVNLTEVQIALGASCRCNENLTIYGGPFLHFVGGQLKDEYSEVDPDTGGLFNSKFKWHIKQDSALGGYIGAQINFAENYSFNLEYQKTSDASAFGMSLLFKF
jgi:hypothetical protein